MTTEFANDQQALPAVVAAELRRHLRHRRTRVAHVVCAALALVGAFGLLGLARLDPTLGSAGFAVPLSLELAAGTIGLIMSLVALSTVTGETGDGTVLASLLLVPDRRRLLIARTVAWPVVATVMLLGLSPLVLVLGLVVGLPGSVDVLQYLVGLGLASLAVALMVGSAFFAATALRRGATAMAVAIGCLLVLPLAVGVLHLTGLDALRPFFGTVLNALPGVAALKALSVSAAVTEGWAPVVEGLAVLAGWALVTGLAAVSRFAREGTTTG